MEAARIGSNLLKYMYTNTTLHVKINKDQKTDKIQTFIQTLENVFKSLPWKTTGMNIDGIYLSYLRFADDYVLKISPILKWTNTIE